MLNRPGGSRFMRDYHDIIHSQIIFHICIQEICDFLKAIKLFFFYHNVQHFDFRFSSEFIWFEITYLLKINV